MYIMFVLGSENFPSKYFCFILLKNFSPMYLIMDVFFLPILGLAIPDNFLHSGFQVFLWRLQVTVIC